MGLWPSDEIPQERLADSEVKDARLFRVILVRDNKPITSEI